SRARNISCRWGARKPPARRRSLVVSVGPQKPSPSRTVVQLATHGGSMRSLAAVLASILFFGPFALCQEEHHHALTEDEVGSVHFSTSCRADLAGSFNRAVALLHSFQYEDARQAFAEIARLDPQCAMAQWGIAMSHYHGMWDNGDLAAGRAALEKAQQS